MSELQSEFLFEMKLDVSPGLSMGKTPFGKRWFAEVTGGSFAGPRMRGRALPGGGDWALMRADHVLQLDVRITLETDDGAIVYVTYRGARHGPKDVIARLAAGEPADPADYYFRTAPFFETASEKYAWLNGIICVGKGQETPDGVIYRLFQVL